MLALFIIMFSVVCIGVSTIAGGLSKAYGHQDGPAQNASFSSDFELTFVPSICALLVADHGNQLVRQIDLKPEDCARDSHSGTDFFFFNCLYDLPCVLFCFFYKTSMSCKCLL